MRTLVFGLALVGTSACGIDNGFSDGLQDVVVPYPSPIEPTDQIDRLVQVEVPEVDVLWVVDNSGSMGGEQDQLAANFPVFMNYFLNSGLDYHIGLTTTDMSNGGERGILMPAAGYRWIDNDTVSASSVFAEMTGSIGVTGSADEMGRDATFSALEIQAQPYMPNEGFLREEASLHVVVISDENDYSEAIGLGEFVDWMNNLKPTDDMVTFSSIVSPGGGCDWEEGTDYIAVTNAVGGEFESICTEDWEPMLNRLGLQASGLKREYFLSQLPVPGTIEVWVEEVSDAGTVHLPFEEETDWLYNPSRNSIEFLEYVPNALSEVYVHYEVLAAAEEG